MGSNRRYSRHVNIEQATGGYIVHVHRWENDNLEVEAIVCMGLQAVLGAVVCAFAQGGERYRIERVGSEMPEQGENHE